MAEGALHAVPHRPAAKSRLADDAPQHDELRFQRFEVGLGPCS
jgi:hypothetical protein